MSFEAVDVRDLLERPGSSRAVEVKGSIESLGGGLANLPEGEEIEAGLVLASVIEGILATGRVSGKLRFTCARCLRDFDSPVVVEVTELFGRTEDPDAYSLDPAGWVDPEPMIRDAIGLEIPFSPLCKPDCLGLCEICGGDRNKGECPGDHHRMDPRWEGLDEVLQAMESERNTS